MFSLKSFIEEIESQELMEGINDPSIFKAVFLAGGPGSGKSFIVRNAAFKALGLKVVSSDDAFEHQLKKAGLELNPTDIGSQKGQSIRLFAKDLTNIKHRGYLTGRLGLAIDGTGAEFERIRGEKEQLEKVGYETAMIFVNTSLETAQKRNKQRARTLPEDLVREKWEAVQRNLGAFQNIFGAQMYIIDNNDESDVEANTTQLFKKLRKWTTAPIKNYRAKKWLVAHSNRFKQRKK